MESGSGGGDEGGGDESGSQPNSSRSENITGIKLVPTEVKTSRQNIQSTSEKMDDFVVNQIAANLSKLLPMISPGDGNLHGSKENPCTSAI